MIFLTVTGGWTKETDEDEEEDEEEATEAKSEVLLNIQLKKKFTQKESIRRGKRRV